MALGLASSTNIWITYLRIVLWLPLNIPFVYLTTRYVVKRMVTTHGYTKINKLNRGTYKFSPPLPRRELDPLFSVLYTSLRSLSLSRSVQSYRRSPTGRNLCPKGHNRTTKRRSGKRISKRKNTHKRESIKQEKGTPRKKAYASRSTARLYNKK